MRWTIIRAGNDGEHMEPMILNWFTLYLYSCYSSTVKHFTQLLAMAFALAVTRVSSHEYPCFNQCPGTQLSTLMSWCSCKGTDTSQSIVLLLLSFA